MDEAQMSEGERWSRELLADLRAANYGPAAWRDFAARSFERAGATRRERPALARQARRWGVGGASGTFLLASFAGSGRASALAWWGLCWGMLETHLGMLEGPGAEARPRLGAADALTLVRVGLVPFAAAPSSRGGWGAIAAAGLATDVADGRLARRNGVTRLGRELDACADAAFFTAAAVGAARFGWLPRSSALALQARHLGGVGLTSWYWFAHGKPPPGSYGAARWSGAPTAVGLLLAAVGRRREAGALLTITAAAAAAAHAVVTHRETRQERDVQRRSHGRSQSPPQ